MEAVDSIAVKFNEQCGLKIYSNLAKIARKKIGELARF
jgi:hypothetical protein